MDVIKNYIDSMFASLPVTDDVIKAKYALIEMMEDKYNELISEGRTENEAIGIVISEFGNLNELAEELGINTYVKEEEKPGRFISLDDVKEFIDDKFKSALLLAIGVCCCIICSIPCIIVESFADKYPNPELIEGAGAVGLFIILAIGVSLIILSSNKMAKWSFMKKEMCSVDFMTVDYVKAQKELYKTSIVSGYIIGIALCILCATPSIIMNNINYMDNTLENLSGAGVLLLIGIGVAFIILSKKKQSAFENILTLNESGIIIDDKNDLKTYKSKNMQAVMSVFWPTVTAIYLIISFLTFAWHITWIIWPVAGISKRLIDIYFAE